MTMVFVLAPIILLVLCRQCLSQVAVRCPPTLLYPVKSTVLYFQEQDSVTLNCSATGSPPPRYKWTHNGTEVHTSPNINVDALTGTVHITNFSRNLEGIYRCIATVDFDNGKLGRSNATNVSPPVRLRMIYLEVFDGPGLQVHRRNQYEYLSIPCDDNKLSVARELGYDWHHNSNNSALRYDGGRIFIDKNGTLHYAFVDLGDAKDNSTISCGIKTRVGPLLYIHRGSGNVVQVSPFDVNQVPKQAPVLEYSTQTVVAEKDTSAVLECVFSGFDDHVGKARQWWRMASGQPIPIDGSRITESIGGQGLTITNVSVSYEGTYECVGNNSYGQTTGQTVLDVTSEPLFTNGPPGYMTVIQGRDAEISCDARSLPGDSPPGLPVWFINGEKIGKQYDRTKFHIDQNYTHLTVKNTQKLTDIMCVQCEVANNVGTAFGSSCLRILLPITVVKAPPAIQKIRHGERVKLTAIATTDPAVQLHYRWEFGSDRFDVNTTPSHIVIDPATMEAYMDTGMVAENKLEEVAGHYNIVIYHNYETKVLGTTVIISGTIQDPAATSGESLLSRGNTAITIIVVLIAAVLFVLLLTMFTLKPTEINVTWLKRSLVTVTLSSSQQWILDEYDDDACVATRPKQSVIFERHYNRYSFIRHFVRMQHAQLTALAFHQRKSDT